MQCKKCLLDLPQNALYCPFCGRAINYSRSAKKRGNGQGTAFKRGSTWTAEITDYYYDDKDGKRKRKKKTKGGFPTKAKALEYCAFLRVAPRSAPKLSELFSFYEKNSLPKLSKDKQIAYNKAHERLAPVMDRRIDTLTTKDLQNVVNDNASSYYTAKDMKTVLSHLYQDAMANQFVTINLSQFIILPDLKEKEAQAFTPEEVDKLWDAFLNGDSFVGFLLLMIYSGMMPAELFACQKSMVDLDKCEIYGCGKKTRKTSVIVFADVARPVVEVLLSLYDGDLLYPFHRTEWYDEYHETTKRVGVRDLPPYSCRHTTGTEAARQNLNASMIQKIMRHAKITTSQRYIHLGTDEAHNGINSITHKLPTNSAETVENTTV